MNAPPRFPQHAPGELPDCFNCHQQLPPDTPVHPSGFPPGRGARMALCARCCMSTHFDLKEPKP